MCYIVGMDAAKNIVLVIIVFIGLFILDMILSDQLRKLYEECSGLLEDIKKVDKQKYEEIQKFYGKDFDIIGHRTYQDFPFSLYYNIKDISTLGFLRDRLRH